MDGIVYYSTGDVAILCGKNIQTVQNWDKYSDDLESKGKSRLIPKPIRGEDYLDRPGKRYWTEAQTEEIKNFSKGIKRGDMAKFNRQKWGVRGEEIKNKLEEKSE